MFRDRGSADLSAKNRWPVARRQLGDRNCAKGLRLFVALTVDQVSRFRNDCPFLFGPMWFYGASLPSAAMCLSSPTGFLHAALRPYGNMNGEPLGGIDGREVR